MQKLFAFGIIQTPSSVFVSGGKNSTKRPQTFVERTINGTPANGVEKNAKVVTPHQWFGWISSSEKHFECLGLNCAQATGGLLYQRACVMLK